MKHVVELLRSRNEQQVVVVSAMQGVTNALIELANTAAAGNPKWKLAISLLEARHVQTARTLLGPEADPLVARLASDFEELSELLQKQTKVGAVSNDLLELVSGLGEVWSSRMVDAALRRSGTTSRWLDAREVVVVEQCELGAMVQWQPSKQKLISHFGTPGPCTVVTGFVARTLDGRITTLGRNGSDYSGAIFASLFDATELNLWSDVKGVFSADPRIVPEAVLIDRLSYAEACELAYFGASVIHPQTMAPAVERGIPIFARSTFHPEHPGTRISNESGPLQPVKGVTTFKDLAILNIEGAGMIGVPGTAARAFEALHRAGISVVMISQGSSEHSICCTIRQRESDTAQRVLREAFSRELAAGLVTDIAVSSDIAVLAVVGDGMAGKPGVSAQLFDSLGRAKVNVRMIAQGASERNISVAIDAGDAPRALRAVHAGFYLSPETISIGVIGPGHVGGAFLRQVSSARGSLLNRKKLDLRIRAIGGSRNMVLGDPMVQDRAPSEMYDRPMDLQAFADHIHADHLPHAVIVDCSGQDAIANHYAQWLSRGIHVVTPNKCAGSGPLDRYQAIMAAGSQFRYEATVGAGLPIITTLRDLIHTGDEVQSVSGILSGTLAYLFNRFDGSLPLSTLVQQARVLGYTEPDPRDDLSGLDVARKLVILARECGWKLSLDQVHVESLVPKSLRMVSCEEFLNRLPEMDSDLLSRLHSAQASNRVLRYVAQLTADGNARVTMVDLPTDHAFAHTQLTDNVVQFTTKRYCTTPLVIQGPGAGPEVTAAGVFADLLRVAASMGAHV